jgi:hypothetical protein
MEEGARDFRSGQTFDQTVFFDESVDIHHIFPEAWCKEQKIDVKVYDAIINKTPLSYRTNRILSGSAPSKYIARLEQGRKDDPPIEPAVLDECFRSHCIDPGLLRADAFQAFMADREKRLLSLIAKATGHQIVAADSVSAEEDVPEEIARDSGTIQVAAE